MRIFLMGHRGVGKTSLLKRLASYLPDYSCFDLDLEIERQCGKSIPEIWKDGERSFREIEKRVFKTLLERAPAKTVVALGAGYAGDFPEGHKIWIRRESDRDGRIFLDRPRLNENTDLLTEFRERFDSRESGFEAHADVVWTLPEGLDRRSAWEENFFRSRIEKIGGTLTILPAHLKKSNLKAWIDERLRWGLSYFELRNDLISHAALEELLELIPREHVLASYRSNGQWALTPDRCALLDWDLSLSEKIPEASNLLLSWHGRKDRIEDSFSIVEQYKQKSQIFKWAPFVKSMDELKRVHGRLKDFPGLEFYPRSEGSHSRWSWYRLLSSPTQQLSFWREDRGSSHDQPTLAQRLSLPAKFRNFAAVLGEPVLHSFSPVEHEDFFKAREMPFVAIPLRREEGSQGNLDFLVEMGLRAAAVTSPLKEAFTSEPVNTLVWPGEKLPPFSANTDRPALLACLGCYSPREMVCWGSGAMSKILKGLFPEIEILSARQIFAPSLKNKKKVLIWAAGAEPQQSLSPDFLNPQLVYDLGYQQNSAAKSFAQLKGATYISGLELFKKQAALQQLFFSERLTSQSI
jgi:shikimate kinase